MFSVGRSIEGQKHPMLHDLRMGHAGPKTFTLPLQLKWLATRGACSLKIRTILNSFLILFKFHHRPTSFFGISQVFTIVLMIKSFNLTVCTILSWLNCYHLFVWSVFSPKLLYEGVVSLVFGVFVLTVSTVSKI